MAVILYSVLRLGLFALALLGLWATGMGGWLLVVVAAVAAGALSYVLLGHQRTAAVRLSTRAWSGSSRMLLTISRAQASSPIPIAPATAGQVTRSAWVYVVPSTATSPKNRKTPTSPRPR